MATKEVDKKGRESRSKKRPAQRGSPLVDSTEAASSDQQSSAVHLKLKERLEAAAGPQQLHLSELSLSLFVPHRLTRFRWIVPANGEVVLKIWFYSELPGTFSQTFNFELMGTKRLYQLLCRGVCSFPSISTDYRCVYVPALTTAGTTGTMFSYLAAHSRLWSFYCKHTFISLFQHLFCSQDSVSHL